MNLRQITPKDQIELKKVYFDSINSINSNIYSPQQKLAWSSQAWASPYFSKILQEGKGWLIQRKYKVIAFSIRYPSNKIALLYCRGAYQRKGNGIKLIDKIENEAIEEGFNNIKTEASLISYRLFLKRNWKILRKENIIIKDTSFIRYKMIKYLNN